jgi:hypothetical protein
MTTTQHWMAEPYTPTAIVQPPRDAPNALWHFAICAAVASATADFAGLHDGTR